MMTTQFYGMDLALRVLVDHLPEDELALTLDALDGMGETHALLSDVLTGDHQFVDSNRSRAKAAFARRDEIVDRLRLVFNDPTLIVPPARDLPKPWLYPIMVQTLWRQLGEDTRTSWYLAIAAGLDRHLDGGRLGDYLLDLRDLLRDATASEAALEEELADLGPDDIDWEDFEADDEGLPKCE